MATYYASKAYVQSLTLALHAELGPQVKVTALCPGPVRTEFWERADAGRTVLARMALPAPAIAHAGYCALAANRALCAPGLTAKAIVFLSRLMPRVILGRIAGLLQRPSGRS